MRREPIDLMSYGTLLAEADLLDRVLAFRAAALASRRPRSSWLKVRPIVVSAVAAILVFGRASARAQEASYVPVKWERFVTVEGQALPVPEQWLQDEEARIAHGLRLPGVASASKPFDFAKARWKAWLPGTPRVAVQYFNHLCSSQAGEWVFKTVQNVEGLYFARPQAAPTSDQLTDPHGLEMPWIQRIFVLQGNKAQDNGTWFIQPPQHNYRFVEQPRRAVKWQAQIVEPYIRLFGYTREKLPVPGVYGVAPDERDWYSYRDKTPMQVIGVSKLASRYGYTWRGIRRERDREHGIAGGEVLIYDLQSKEVLAVRRQFLIASKNPRGEEKAMWEIAARCAQLPRNGIGAEFTQFAFDVLQTIEPSKTGK